MNHKFIVAEMSSFGSVVSSAYVRYACSLGRTSVYCRKQKQKGLPVIEPHPAGQMRIQAPKAYTVCCIYEHSSSRDRDRITIFVTKVAILSFYYS